MMLHVEGLVDDICGQTVQMEDLLWFVARMGGVRLGQHHRDEEFIESFSLIALCLIFDHLKRLDGLFAGSRPD
jgi:hypothetical protein